MGENDNLTNNNDEKTTVPANENTNSPFANLSTTQSEPVSSNIVEPTTNAANSTSKEVPTSDSVNNMAETISNKVESSVEETPEVITSSIVEPAPSYYSNNTNTNSNPTNSAASFTSADDSTSKGFGIASLIIGILSIPLNCCCCLGFILSILGIVFGCLQPKDDYGKKPGIAIAGIVISSISIVLSIIGFIIIVVTNIGLNY